MNDNELIAEFMGGSLIPYPDGFFPGHYGYICHKSSWWNKNALAYNESWDWLMPVVHKIKKDKHNPNEMFMGTTLERHLQYSQVTDLPISLPIEIVYKRIVEFIKWYNEQNKKS